MWFFYLLSMIIIFFSIPLLFKIKDYLYNRYSLTKNRLEEPVFCVIMFFLLFTIGYYMNEYFYYWVSLPFLAYIMTPVVHSILKRIRIELAWVKN
jgi:hypothetical protein